MVLAKSASSGNYLNIPFEKRIDPMLDNGLFPSGGDNNKILPPLQKKYSWQTLTVDSNIGNGNTCNNIDRIRPVSG